tara:strand:- start:8266 stop:8991 length:726 start_codon:yes stop_codon:yes gene_type:complete
LAPAFDRGEMKVVVRSGDVHRDMELSQRMPSVCTALDSQKFESEFGVRLIERTGPEQGANAMYLFERAGTAPMRPIEGGAEAVAVLADVPNASSTIEHERSIYLVSCVSKKLHERAPAKDLYISDWFRKARRYVEATGCPWFILSAEHGLVAPDQPLYPYETTLNTMPIAERRRWAESVDAQLLRLAPNAKHVKFLAGARYREFLQLHLQTRGIGTDVPMRGLRIGEQLAWLSREIGRNHV